MKAIVDQHRTDEKDEIPGVPPPIEEQGCSNKPGDNAALRIEMAQEERIQPDVDRQEQVDEFKRAKNHFGRLRHEKR